MGHGQAERTLLSAWRSGRLPHAWLISGRPGIGKATLAYRFARFVLAGDRQDAPGLFGETVSPSLQIASDHPVFRRVAAGGHGDLLTIERVFDEKRQRLKLDIPVEEVRRIAPFLRLTAAEGGWRVVVVDGAERMNAAGQNAILKILEEPPPGALLLLVSANPGALLPTIRSRCRKLGLQPLDEATTAALLERHRPDVPGPDRLALARLAEGSPGRAIDLADAGGLELYRSMVGLLAGLPALDLAAAHGWTDGLVRGGDGSAWAAATALLVWWLARLARAPARGTVPAEIVPGEAALMTRLVAGGGLDRWMEVWEKVDRLFTRAETATLDRKQVVLNALLLVAAAA